MAKFRCMLIAILETSRHRLGMIGVHLRTDDLPWIGCKVSITSVQRTIVSVEKFASVAEDAVLLPDLPIQA